MEGCASSHPTATGPRAGTELDPQHNWRTVEEDLTADGDVHPNPGPAPPIPTQVVHWPRCGQIASWLLAVATPEAGPCTHHPILGRPSTPPPTYAEVVALPSVTTTQPHASSAEADRGLHALDNPLDNQKANTEGSRSKSRRRHKRRKPGSGDADWREPIPCPPHRTGPALATELQQSDPSDPSQAGWVDREHRTDLVQHSFGGFGDHESHPSWISRHKLSKHHVNSHAPRRNFSTSSSSSSRGMSAQTHTPHQRQCPQSAYHHSRGECIPSISAPEVQSNNCLVRQLETLQAQMVALQSAMEQLQRAAWSQVSPSPFTTLERREDRWT